jgi:tetratricopeptide (TPR) repeat protein
MVIIMLIKGEYEKAVTSYDAALKIHEDSPIVWRNEGIAYLDWGINNQSIAVILDNRPSYSYAKQLIDYCGNSSLPANMERQFFEFSYQCFSKAATFSSDNPELILYKGITGIYCFPSTTCDPLRDFNETLTYINRMPADRIIPPLISIKNDAAYGEGVIYLKMGSTEKANECFSILK